MQAAVIEAGEYVVSSVAASLENAAKSAGVQMVAAAVDKVKEEVMEVEQAIEDKIVRLGKRAGNRITDYYKRKKSRTGTSRDRVTPVEAFTMEEELASNVSPLAEMDDEDADEADGDEMKDDDKVGYPVFLNSFLNMRYKRRRRYRKKRKLVTKRGVKNIIANYIPTNRATYAQCFSGFVYGPFGQRGLNMFPVCAGGVWNNSPGTPYACDLREMYTCAVQALDSTAGTITSNFAWKNYRYEFMFHNPITYGEICTVWLIKQIDTEEDLIQVNNNVPPTQNATVPFPVTSAWQDKTYANLTAVHGPLKIWKDEWTEVQRVSPVQPINFYQDFTTFPTSYQQWNKKFKILKKVKFYLSPGQTKVWHCKVPSGKWESSAHINSIGNNTDVVYYGGTTCFFMFQLEGLPTHQNGVSNNPFEVNRSCTGMEFTGRCYADVAMTSSQKFRKMQFIANDTNSITAAKSLIPDTATTIATV